MHDKQTRRRFLGSVLAGASTCTAFRPSVPSAAGLGRSASAAYPGPVTPAPAYHLIDPTEMTVLPSEGPVLVGETMQYMECRWAHRPLMRALGIRYPAGEKVAQTVHNRPLPSGPTFLIGTLDDHPELTSLYHRLEAQLPEGLGNRLGEEGYLLSTGPQGVRLVANGPAGVFYGVQTLLQLLNEDKAVPRGDVVDVPEMGFRGVHFGFNDPENIPLLKKYISEELPRYKANTLVLMVNYAFKFKSHPEINERTMLDELQAREIARYGRNYNIRVIPLINCFGHQSWRPTSIRGLLRAYPQFNETPCMTGEDVLMYNWCPSDPRIAPIVFELIDELIDSFETDTVHLGMDEVLFLGVCHFCSKKSPAEHMAKVVNEFYEHVVGRRGTKMMLWGDRLINGFETPYNPMNGSRNGTHPAIKLIPKDILLCDWHYHLHESYPSVDQFEEHGFDYVICGWRKRKAIRAFIEYATKRGKDHFKGYLQTNWGGIIPMLQYLVQNGAQQEKEEIRNYAECNRLGLELAWHGLN